MPHYPPDQFTMIESQNPWIDRLYAVQKRRSTNFETLKLRKGRPGTSSATWVTWVPLKIYLGSLSVWKLQSCFLELVRTNIYLCTTYMSMCICICLCGCALQLPTYLKRLHPKELTSPFSCWCLLLKKGGEKVFTVLILSIFLVSYHACYSKQGQAEWVQTRKA